MKINFKHTINLNALRIALGSFILGTVCLLLFKSSGDTGFVGIGFWYTMTAALVNVIVLVVVLINGLLHFTDYKEHLTTLLAVLTNIPIALFYINLL